MTPQPIPVATATLVGPSARRDRAAWCSSLSYDAIAVVAERCRSAWLGGRFAETCGR